MNTSEVLNKAADHIQQYGHRKRGLGRPGEPTCAIGALQAVSDDWMDVGGSLIKYLGRADIAQWNNAPERTAAEVIEVLRAAAVIEASRERQSADQQAAIDAVTS